MFQQLEQINARPRPFERYTAMELWTDPHIAQRMLALHLDPDNDMASRNAAFIDRSVEWMASRFAIDDATRIADFGCGPGLYTTRLARRGARVTGIDFSAGSIAHAEQVAAQEGLTVDHVNQDYLSFETEERFHLLLMIMDDLCALGPEQRRGLLGKLRRLLQPGGSLLLDVCSLAGFSGRAEAASYEENLMGGFWSPGRYFGFVNTFKYEPDKVALDKYTIVEATRTRTIYNWMQYFSPEALERELGACGLEVRELLGDVAGAPYDPSATEFAVVAGAA